MIKEKKIKALWLPSWYPTKYHIKSGLFIEKQAIATAELCDIALIYLSPSIEKDIEIDIKYNPFFTIVVLIPETRLKYFKLYYYLKYFFKAYKILLKEWGKPDIIHMNVISLKLTGVLFLRFFNSIPLILSEHSSRYGISVREGKTLKDYLLIKLHYLGIKKLLVVTKSVGEDLKKLGLAKSYQVVPNIIDDSIFNYKENLKKDKKHFLHVSTLDAVKGVEDIIKAFKLLADIRTDFVLSIVGQNEDAVMLYKTFAYQIGLISDQISFDRMLTSEHIAQKMQLADYFIMNSQIETFGIVAVEAQRCGLPVISYPTPGMIEVLLPENTIFFEEHSPEAILKALLLSFDKAFDRKAVSESISDRYNAKSVGQNIFDVYVECLDKK
jgi:glycosyltransferase involved in cell wall biosynthesis